MIQKIRKSIPYLLPVLVAILVVGLILSRVIEVGTSSYEPEITISASEASEHIGTVAEVCGDVVSVDFIQEIEGRPTFINFGEEYPNQEFTAVIWFENLHQWQTPPDQTYQNREVCVTGQIQDHEGTPQIVVKRNTQLELAS